ncbi:hypothetical protein E9228_000524 [Curtobacterium flaccumfaciens]|uniref:Winged helix DNA-binding domain-containing protein n=1 Tax=Curtobacterium salicis TaxID=1779862 RepID=A0ABX0T7V5_9MICO|nr:hypothetical protein [Curtobacterium sp. WW7]
MSPVPDTTIRSARLTAGLVGRPVGSSPTARAAAPLDVVRHLVAVQAQDFNQSLWAIGARSLGTTRTDVLAAFDRGELVRSWPMRGTLHTTTPDDLRVLLSLTATRTMRTVATRFRQVGLQPEDVDRARDALLAALSSGVALEREDAMRSFRDAGVDPGESREYILLLAFALEARIAWGPSRRVGQALVLLDDRAPVSSAVRELVEDAEAALVHVLLGYLRGHGPATLADFGTWIGLPLTAVRRARTTAAHQVVDADATRVAIGSAAPASSAAVAHLLPAFDEYVLGLADRSALFVDPTDRVASRNGIGAPVAVVRGRIVGTWSRPADDGTILLTPFRALGAADERALHRAADHLGSFLERPTSLRIDAGTGPPVTPAPAAPGP